MAIEIKVNDEIIYTVSDAELQILGYVVNSDNLTALLKKRIVERLTHFTAQAQAALIQGEVYSGKLAVNGVTHIPLDTESLSALIFAQPNYLDKKARDLLE